MGFCVVCLLVVFQGMKCLSRPSNSSTVIIHENSQELINYIKSSYDNAMMPNMSAGTPLDVKIDLYVTSIEPIDQKTMHFTVQMYFRQYWQDDSLRFKLSNSSCTDYLSLYPQLISKVWIPDTYVENEVRKDVRNRAMLVFYNGQILLSERVSIRAYCPLDLRRYPMDVQECSLKLQSYSYAGCDLRYSWFYEGRGESLRLSKSIQLPNYDISGLSTVTETDDLKTGSYSRIVAKFQFTHKVMYVLMRDYVPAAFIVVTSWLSFYIDPAASPARVSLAVITVLSIATQLSSTFRSTPEVSYIKAIDWYVIICFLFVFAAMIEYGFIHRYAHETSKYGASIVADKKNKDSQNCGEINFAMEEKEFDTGHKKIRNGAQDYGERKREKDRLSQYQSNYGSNFALNLKTRDPNLHEEELKKSHEKSRSFLPCFMFSYPGVPCADAISRIAFPLLFLTFNVVYWFYMFTTKSS